MHTLERIALWTVIVLIIFFLFFKNSSGFTASQNNLMSMNEFNWLPQPIKDSYASNMTKIINALNPKVTSYWNYMPASDQQKFLKQYSDATDTFVQMIKNVTYDQIKDMVNKASQYTSNVGQVNMSSPQAMPMASPTPMGLSTSPSPIAMASPTPMGLSTNPSPIAMAQVNQVNQAASFASQAVSVFPGANFTGALNKYVPSSSPITFNPPMTVGSFYVPQNYVATFTKTDGTKLAIGGGDSGSSVPNANLTVSKLEVTTGTAPMGLSTSPSPMAMGPVGMSLSASPIVNNQMTNLAATSSFPTDRVTFTTGSNFTGDNMNFPPGDSIIPGTPITIGSVYVPPNYKVEFYNTDGSMSVFAGEVKIPNFNKQVSKFQVKH
jgi:hypothetical protein